MPKLYQTKKIKTGLKIGLREPNGLEWFADITLDRNKRTCRKINVPFNNKNTENLKLAEKKALNLYEELNNKQKLDGLNKINMPQWQTKFFNVSLLLLWATGILWVIFNQLNLSSNEQILALHGILIIPALLSLGILISSHIPSGWKPKKRKFSGLSLTSALLLLILSGFLISEVGHEHLFLGSNIELGVSLTHASIGFVLVPLIFWHYRKKSSS